jgi:hypothetical protein
MVMEKEIDIPIDADYSLRNKNADEKERWNKQEIGEYTVKVKLSDEQKDSLKDSAFLEFEALKDERVALGLDKKWEDRDNQYDGSLATIKNIEFAIDVRESKIKVDSIVRACKEAFFPDDGDIVDVSPRPETARNDGWAIAERQQQFIGFAMTEEIKPEMAFTKVFQSVFKKYVGILKVCWSYRQETRRREEHWEGKTVVVGQGPDGQPIIDNEGLRSFLQAYPDAPTRYPGQVKKLLLGESVDIVVLYKEQIRNNPQFKYVKIEDFYVRNACEYNDGLLSEHLIGERQQYSYWELMKKQDDGEFENVEDVWNEAEGDGKNAEDYKTKSYDVMEFTTYLKLNPADKEETKIKCWFSEERKVFLGAIAYPFYSIDIDYIGFWATTNDKGFYGDAQSVMFDLRDTHIAQDALISLMLHSMYIRNIVTPIVREGSEVEQMFLDHDFKSGKPIPVDDLSDDVRKAFDFIQWPAVDTQGGLVLLEKMKRIGSDVSRVSDLVTGGESEIDPNAPASKTIALLQQSGIGIKDYIKMVLPSFNICASNLLQLYYQMSTDDRKYRIRTKGKQVTGKDIFGDIKRAEMIVHTNIQSRAAAFAFDKVMEKREGMAAYQLIMSNPYAARQPKLLYKALKTLVSTFGGRWKTLGDVDLMSPEDFDAQQMQIAMQAVKALFQQAQQQAQVTGVAPNPRDVIQAAPEAVTQAQAVAYNPELAEEAQK